MNCALALAIMTVVAAILGWVLIHQGKAMAAQKNALEATRNTFEALKIQSELKIEPLRQTVDFKDVVIESLQAQLSVSAERKALVEEKLQANQDATPEFSRLLLAEAKGESSYSKIGGHDVLQSWILLRNNELEFTSRTDTNANLFAS